MAKTLVYTPSSPKSVKISDTDTNLYLQLAKDNVAVDLSTAKSIDVKIADYKKNYLKDISINPADLSNASKGVLILPLNSTNISGLPAGQYAFEVWIETADSQQEIYPDVDMKMFSILNNVVGGTTVIAQLTLQQFEDKLSDAYNLADSANKKATGNMAAFNQATSDLKQAQADLANGGYAKTTDVNAGLASKADNSALALKADKTYVDSVTSAIASGAPKGTFANLAALQAAYPSGTDGIWITQDDGYWCFWNGAMWTKGGNFIASKLLFSDSFETLFNGMNLLTGSSKTPLSVTGWGKPDLFGTLTGCAGKTYRYKVNISNVSGSVSQQIVIRDASGQALNFDGSPNDKIYLLPSSVWATESTLLDCLVKVPSNAFSIGFGIGTLSESTSFSYDSVQVTEGTTDYDYSQNINDMSEADALQFLFSNLYDAVKSVKDEAISLPKVYITGDFSGLLASNTTSVLPVKLVSKNRVLKGYSEMEWQGDSSKNLPKKGFKFKLYDTQTEDNKIEFRPMPTFYLSNSFNLKAYYTNRYNCNDPICAEMYRRFIANNSTAPKELLLANDFGTIQSMPCLLYFGNDFYGLMELNTKSGSDLFGMDKTNADQIALQSNSSLTGARFKATSATVGDTGDFTLESDNDTNAQSALTGLVSKINSSVADADFKANIESIFDINSICDYIIFNEMINNQDAWDNKNQLYLTYDNGSHWYMLGYDFDSTLGSSWQPGTVYADDSVWFLKSPNSFLSRFIKFYPDKILARFNELNSLGVLNVQDLQKIVDDKISEIGEGALQMEWARWPQNPVYTQSNEPDVQHIKYMLSYRKSLLKSKLESMQGSAS